MDVHCIPNARLPQARQGDLCEEIASNGTLCANSRPVSGGPEDQVSKTGAKHGFLS
jgi:hypothetical protein